MRGAYDISPPRAFFGFVRDSAATLERRVVIRRYDGMPFAIVKTSSEDRGISSSFAERQRVAAHVLVLTLDCKKVTAFVYGQILVETDDPLEPTLKVPFAASRREGENK